MSIIFYARSLLVPIVVALSSCRESAPAGKAKYLTPVATSLVTFIPELALVQTADFKITDLTQEDGRGDPVVRTWFVEGSEKEILRLKEEILRIKKYNDPTFSSDRRIAADAVAGVIKARTKRKIEISSGQIFQWMVAGGDARCSVRFLVVDGSTSSIFAEWQQFDN
jgi:hypothetical protein